MVCIICRKNAGGRHKVIQITNVFSTPLLSIQKSSFLVANKNFPCPQMTKKNPCQQCKQIYYSFRIAFIFFIASSITGYIITHPSLSILPLLYIITKSRYKNCKTRSSTPSITHSCVPPATSRFSASAKNILLGSCPGPNMLAPAAGFICCICADI